MTRGKSVAEFNADLEKFAQHIERSVGVARRRVALDLFERINEKTPVGNAAAWQPLPSGKPRRAPPGYVGGRLRASWNMTDGQPSDEVQPPGQSSYPAKGKITATFSKPYDVTWIVNNLAYGEAVEFGHSKQAASGMVRVSLSEIEAQLMSSVSELALK